MNQEAPLRESKSIRPRHDDDDTVPEWHAPTDVGGVLLPWRPVTPREDEFVRWECVDGRWVSIGLGTGPHEAMARVQNSGLFVEHVETFEHALAVAKRWRTT